MEIVNASWRVRVRSRKDTAVDSHQAKRAFLLLRVGLRPGVWLRNVMLLLRRNDWHCFDYDGRCLLHGRLLLLLVHVSTMLAVLSFDHACRQRPCRAGCIELFAHDDAEDARGHCSTNQHGKER